MVFDADLGLANAQLAMGCRTPYNFSHVLSGEKTVNEIIIEGPMGVKLVPGASGIQHMASLSKVETADISQAFSDIEEDLAYFIVDLSAGLADTGMPFVRACHRHCRVLKNEPCIGKLRPNNSECIYAFAQSHLPELGSLAVASSSLLSATGQIDLVKLFLKLCEYYYTGQPRARLK